MTALRRKKCLKCREKRLLSDFGSDGSGGIQSYCKHCKRELGKKRMQQNVPARLRHHISTRVRDQLGDKCPSDITAKLDKYLGYSMGALVKGLKDDLKAREGEDASLRRALNDGAHVDHIKPLRLFQVFDPQGEIDWEEFKRCWAISNLRAISAEENLAKGGRFEDSEEEQHVE